MDGPFLGMQQACMQADSLWDFSFPQQALLHKAVLSCLQCAEGKFQTLRFEAGLQVVKC
jgi:hypothetical protein